jgi:hypothetical protein
MTKSTAIIFILGFALLFKLEEKVTIFTLQIIQFVRTVNTVVSSCGSPFSHWILCCHTFLTFFRTGLAKVLPCLRGSHIKKPIPHAWLIHHSDDGGSEHL